MRLLLVDDDHAQAGLIRSVLADAGYVVDVATSAEEGRTLALVEAYDGILLDLNLPDRNGLYVLSALRREGRDVPVVIVTARGREIDIVRGLDAGADDYIVKPISREILRARVGAAVRRGGARRTEHLALGGLLVDRLAREARLAGVPLPLTSREFSILECLILHAGEVVTRTRLLESVWDMHFDPGSDVVGVHISRLRVKLRTVAPSPRIKTVRSVGFILTLH